MRTTLTRFLSLPLRVKVLSAVALSCVVALLVGVVGLTRLAALEQRSRDIESQALVPSMQLAEMRRAFLQTRVDALADELLPKTGGQDTAHQAYLADTAALDAAIRTYSHSGLTARQGQDLAVLTDAWRRYENLVSGPLLQAAHAGRMADYITMRSGTVGPASKTLGDALDRLTTAEAADARASDVDGTRRWIDRGISLGAIGCADGTRRGMGRSADVAGRLARHGGTTSGSELRFPSGTRPPA